MLMRRSVLLLVLTLAATMAVEPVIHAHSLAPEQQDGCSSYSVAASLRCSVCATTEARVLFAAPELVAPAVASYTLPAASAQVAPATAFTPVPSRAPPVA